VKRKPSKPSCFFVEHGGYPFDVMVTIGMDLEEVRQRLEDFGVELTDDDEESFEADRLLAGRTVMLEGGQSVIALVAFDGTPVCYARLAHEVFHAVTFLMERIGMKLCSKSDEAYAYAVAGLTESILTELRKAPHKRRRTP
jgi:hypothetical protein